MISRLPLIADLQAEAGPGRCPFCEEPLPASKTKPRVHCGALECVRSLERISRRRIRAAAAAAREARDVAYLSMRLRGDLRRLRAEVRP
jgi:hypothetical protein